jgi:hypothetical protein
VTWSSVASYKELYLWRSRKIDIVVRLKEDIEADNFLVNASTFFFLSKVQKTCLPFSFRLRRSYFQEFQPKERKNLRNQVEESGKNNAKST